MPLNNRGTDDRFASSVAGPPRQTTNCDGLSHIHVNGADLAVFERRGSEPPVFLAHATGLHARCWNQIIARIPDRRCIAIDMRGHGLSSKTDTSYEWHTFGEDVAAVVRALEIRGALGVGHSMGAHSLALAAAVAPEAFAELILIEPVIRPRAFYTGLRGEPHFARKRCNRWASPEEMFERFRDRAPFRDWDPAVLRDYCNFGLLPAADGNGYVLACPPEIEAAIYEASVLNDANLYGKLETIEVPVTVIRSSRVRDINTPMDMVASPTAPDLAAHFQHGRDVVTGYSHFIALEAPALIAEYVLKRQPQPPPEPRQSPPG